MTIRELMGTGEHKMQPPLVVAWERLASGCGTLPFPSLWFSALKLRLLRRASWGRGG